jgi:hypothetical protein
LPPGIVSQGYTAAGVAAHYAAYRQATLAAPVDSLPRLARLCPRAANICQSTSRAGSLCRWTSG